MNKKAPPRLYTRKGDCCGCAACFSICSQNAISMVYDDEGFLYPAVETKECIRCYRCLSVCPIKKIQKIGY